MSKYLLYYRSHPTAGARNTLPACVAFAVWLTSQHFSPIHPSPLESTRKQSEWTLIIALKIKAIYLNDIRRLYGATPAVWRNLPHFINLIFLLHTTPALRRPRMGGGWWSARPRSWDASSLSALRSSSESSEKLTRKKGMDTLCTVVQPKARCLALAQGLSASILPLSLRPNARQQRPNGGSAQQKQFQKRNGWMANYRADSQVTSTDQLQPQFSLHSFTG